MLPLHQRLILERMIGFEPTTDDLENHCSRPLSYMRTISKMAEVVGFEPTNTGVKVPCLDQLGYTPIFLKLT